MQKDSNSLNWFEIPALDLSLSQTFYETIFDMKMENSSMEDTEMAFFPWLPGSGRANGAIAKSPNHTPSVEGTIVYLNANPSLGMIVNRIDKAGGKVTIPEMNIGDHGFIAFFIDPAGNNVGLHANAQ